MPSPAVAGSAISGFPEVARLVSMSSAPSQNLPNKVHERVVHVRRAEDILWQFVSWNKDSSDTFLLDDAHSDTTT